MGELIDKYVSPAKADNELERNSFEVPFGYHNVYIKIAILIERLSVCVEENLA